MSSSQPTITVGILTKNRLALLQRAVESILPQLGSDDEIVIFDTGSSDGTREWLASQSLPIRAIFHDHLSPLNFAKARNQIVQTAQKDCVVFTDDDGFVHRNWVGRLRENLSTHQVVGGPCLPGRFDHYPFWWAAGMSWCIGNSPPGTVLRLPDHYPDTSNMGAWKSLFLEHPFGETSTRLDDANKYLGGREDAEWWKRTRQLGLNTKLDPRQIVFHLPPVERLSAKYVIKRAWTDGKAAWMRESNPGHVDSPPGAFMASVFHCFRQIAKRASWETQGPELLWCFRQAGRFSAARSGAHETASWKSLIQAARHETKTAVSDLLFPAVGKLKRNKHWPDMPRSIYISAACHIGDSIMLRPHIARIALLFPDATINIEARFPEMLEGLPKNCVVIDSNDNTRLDQIARECPAAIIPYYPFGSLPRYRRHLAAKAVTFDHDVGFHGRRDPHLACRVVEKNFDVHEHENLFQLFNQWSADFTLPETPLQTEPTSRKPNRASQIIVQLGGGYPAKEWPSDCWLEFFQRLFASRSNLHCTLIGNENWRDLGQQIFYASPQGRITNKVGRLTIPDLISEISAARCVVGACSGPKHIAILQGIPTFTLYGATEPARWGAHRDHHLHDYIEALPDKLTGGELAGLPYDHRMRLLKPEVVLEKVLDHFRRLKI